MEHKWPIPLLFRAMEMTCSINSWTNRTRSIPVGIRFTMKTEQNRISPFWMFNKEFCYETPKRCKNKTLMNNQWWPMHIYILFLA